MNYVHPQSIESIRFVPNVLADKEMLPEFDQLGGAQAQIAVCPATLNSNF
jgi:hypothetical protein